MKSLGRIYLSANHDNKKFLSQTWQEWERIRDFFGFSYISDENIKTIKLKDIKDAKDLKERV